jgi:hypothetical protein
MKTKDLKLVLEKFLTSDAATNARVQVCLPNGEFYDISGMQLMERNFTKEKILKSSALVACSLMLAAWGLTLAACTLSSLELEA